MGFPDLHFESGDEVEVETETCVFVGTRKSLVPGTTHDTDHGPGTSPTSTVPREFDRRGILGCSGVSPLPTPTSRFGVHPKDQVARSWCASVHESACPSVHEGACV